MSDLWLGVIAGVTFILGAFYSGSETAFIAADRIRLKHLAGQGNQRAVRVLELLDAPGYLLSAVLVGTNLAVIGCTTATTVIATRHFGESASTIATVILVPLFLLFNEIIPKGLFLSYANRAALISVGPLRVLTWVFHPVVKGFSVLTDVLTRLVSRGGAADGRKVGMEELLFHISDSREAGLLSAETTALVNRAIALQDLRARDVTKPLDDVVMIDGDAPPETYGEVFSRTGFSRFPVFRDSRDNIVGVMSVHEYMTSPDTEKLLNSLAKPYLVSLDTPIVDVLLEMREQGRHMAVVLDEDGRACGMATMEDILERFVGAITDEFH